MKELPIITNKVVNLVQEVGAFIAKEGKGFDQDSIQVKSKNSLVSYVDETAERKLVEGLKEISPEAGFLTEEKVIEQTEEKELVWVIDPLDGTTNFMHGIPVFSVSVALMQNDEPIVGVVYEINRDEMFSAFQGGGTFLNGQKVAVTGTQTLEDSLTATGFPYYDYKRIDGFIEVLKQLMHETRGVRRLGSAAVDLAYVSCGRYDTFFEYSLNPWDVAAGILLVKEAGGKVNDFQGGSDFLFGKEIVASNPFIHELMLSKVKAI